MRVADEYRAGTIDRQDVVDFIQKRVAGAFRGDA